MIYKYPYCEAPREMGYFNKPETTENLGVAIAAT